MVACFELIGFELKSPKIGYSKVLGSSLSSVCWGGVFPFKSQRRVLINERALVTIKTLAVVVVVVVFGVVVFGVVVVGVVVVGVGVGKNGLNGYVNKVPLL